MKKLPEPQFFTCREAAYSAMEIMTENGFATTVKVDGNVYAVVTVESFQTPTQIRKLEEVQNPNLGFNFTYESGAYIC